MADDEAPLTRAIIGLASQYGSHGYRRITALLRRDGWRVNHKRVERHSTTTTQRDQEWLVHPSAAQRLGVEPIKRGNGMPRVSKSRASTSRASKTARASTSRASKTARASTSKKSSRNGARRSPQTRRAPKKQRVTLDPVTFEVLRHRIWSINDESAVTLKRISGSPVATEVNDFNTSILNAAGDAVVVGQYIVSHAIGQNIIVQNIIADLAENPGINEDDVFITNDPFIGALHQNDVTCAAPIFAEGELLAWTCSTIHQIDVGGPVQGSQGSIGSDSIFQEAPIMTPLKIIEGGLLRKDVEREYLMRSRTQELCALDLRAKIGAINVTKRRILEIVERYGLETIKECFNAIIDYTATRLGERISELPDGVWSHEVYLDYYDGVTDSIYPCFCALTKRGDTITFDFTGTAKQAPAIINCSYSGLMSGLMISVLAFLGNAIPGSPAGVMKHIEVISEPGTVFHATFPAGVSKATTSGSFSCTTLTTACMAKMFAASPKYRDRLMAPWIAGLPTQELFGTDHRGQPFGLTMLDPMAGGAGARSYKDGIDTGGFIRSLMASIANVETYEFRAPILYLYRRQEADTGGPGKYRGGVGVSMMYKAHGVEKIDTNVMHGMGYQHADACGIAGGYPSTTIQFAIMRDSNINEQMSAGALPQSFDDIQGKLDLVPPMFRSYLNRGDVYRCITSGGGGYGDPLLRDPELTRHDVVHGLVSLEKARAVYGVVFEEQSVAVDQAATERQRANIKKQRAEAATRS